MNRGNRFGGGVVGQQLLPLQQLSRVMAVVGVVLIGNTEGWKENRQGQTENKDFHDGRSYYCGTAFEKIFNTITPATISKIPIIAAVSNFCPNTTQAIREIKAMPTPDQMA